MRECSFIAVTPRFGRISKSNYAYQLVRAGQGAGNRAFRSFHPAQFPNFSTIVTLELKKFERKRLHFYHLIRYQILIRSCHCMLF
jgi:hypothetical protein